MRSAPSTLFRSGGTGEVAFAVVVCVSYLAMISTSFETLTSTNLAILIVLGILYTLNGIYGYAHAARVRALNVRILPAYFIVQVLLSGAIINLGRSSGYNAVLMLPLAGQAVTSMEARGVYFTSIGILIAYVSAVYLYSGGTAMLWNSLVSFLAGLVFVLVFTQLTVNEEKARNRVEQLAAQLEQANSRLREYAVQAEELATSRERNRMAREIHDGLGHYLTTIYMQIQAAQAIVESDKERSMNALEKAKNLTQSALVDVRRSVASLRAPEQGRPIQDLIQMLLDDIQVSGIKTAFKAVGTPRAFSPQTELTCYRTTQEALNNVRKHSQATSVSILLDYTDPDVIRLSIEDNGIGAEKITQGGYGLMGLRERVHLVGGEFSTVTAPGQGFKLRIEVPG